MKMARCIVELERIYGIRVGNPQRRNDFTIFRFVNGTHMYQTKELFYEYLRGRVVLIVIAEVISSALVGGDC